MWLVCLYNPEKCQKELQLLLGTSRGLIPGVVRKLFKSPVHMKQGHFYLTIYSTHFIYGYMVKDHSDSQIGNLLLPLHGLLFSISRQDSTYYGLYYTSLGALTE